MLLGTSSHDTKIPACLRVIEGLKKPYQDSSRTMQPDRSMPTPKEGELVEVEFLTHITIPHPKVPHATEPGQLLERNPFGSHSFRQNFLSAGTSLSSSPHSRLSEVPRSLTPFTSETAATKSVAFSSAKGLVTSVLTNNHGPEQNLRFSLASELKSLPRPAGSPSPTPPDDSTSEDDSTSTTSGRSPILPLNSTNGNLPSSSLASRLEQLTADTVRLPLSIDSVKIPSSLSSTESSFESYQTPTNGMSPTRNFLQTTTDIANIFNAGSSEGFSESPRNPSLATRPSMLGLGLFPQSLGNLFFNSFNPTRGMVSDEMEEENSAIDK
ncbi:hypothetical protein BC830DRAFT_1105840 [Chytriomyces sp. MP71]|nr:hypothetical protein BC830DRAFT_1105840 [Chytriomyces sp. MP71]